MKIGIALGTVRPDRWAEVTEEADRLGFESVWLPEHLVLPVATEGSPYAGADHPPVPPEVPVHDAFAFLCFLAGRTEQIRFSTHVYNIGLRHPFVTARAVTTLDIVSGGRAMFGVGASWLAAEWEAVGLDFSTRGRRVDEAIAVCQQLWSEPVIEHHGDFFDFTPVAFEPKPVQKPWPPIHIGGDGAGRAAPGGNGGRRMDPHEPLGRGDPGRCGPHRRAAREGGTAGHDRDHHGHRRRPRRPAPGGGGRGRSGPRPPVDTGQ